MHRRLRRYAEQRQQPRQRGDQDQPAAGILAGLLGVGGGLVLVAALAWLLPLFGVPPEVAMHAALASSLASIVLTAASSARAHARRGSVLWPTVAWMVPGLLLGAWLGSGVAVKLDAQTLRWIVASRQ